MAASKKEILDRYKYLSNKARALFGQQFGEDVAHEAILGMLEGKSLKQNSFFALIDAARKKTTVGYYDKRGNAEPSSPSSKEVDFEKVIPRYNMESPQEDFFRFVMALSMLEDPVHIQMITLVVIYEWPYVEIAKFVGCHPARVSQMVKESLEAFSEVVKRMGK